jgi:hypothetical protein
MYRPNLAKRIRSIPLGAALVAVSLGAACDDGTPTNPGSDASTPTFSATCEGGGRNARACTAGLLVAPDGTAVSNVRVSACTPSTCITGTTNDAGAFVIQGLPVEPHKLEVLGFIRGYFNTIYFMDMTSGQMAIAPAPIKLQPLPPALVKGFDPAVGGELVLAGGGLTFDAAPGALDFPIGTVADGAEATRVPVADLPGFDVAPWAGQEAESFAFLVHPFPLKSDGGVEVALTPPDGQAEAAGYTLYSVHTSTARVETIGPLTRGDDGQWRLEDASGLKHLAILVAVPAP